jgi:two-component system chemotaxis sensor kinase CheA
VNPVDRSLLAIFSGEQAEHVASLRTLLGSRDAAVVVEELLRRMHTLKGAARAVGLEKTEKLTHQAEEVLSRVRQGALEWGDPVRQVLSHALNAIEDVLAATLADRKPPETAGIEKDLARIAGLPDPVEDRPQETSRAETSSPAAVLTDLVRVNPDSLDDLIRHSSQLLMDATVEADGARAEAHWEHVDEVAKEWQRLRRAAGSVGRELRSHPEFQAIAECLAFADSRFAAIGREAHVVATSSRNTAGAFRERAEQVYQSACRIRTTPAGVVLGGFGSMVRDLAQQEGKQIAFDAEGLEIHADRLVLQGLRDPVIHLLRNAVSHGIETPEERARAGKNIQGTIRLLLRTRGDRLALRIEDDGRGLDYEAIAHEARNRGLADEEITQVIFQPGFSTSKTVTDVSGRGVGLSIVQRSVNRLRGEVAVRPGPEGGTLVALLVPLSISTQHVLLVETAGHIFGISAAFVEKITRTEPSAIRIVNGRESIISETGPVVLARLSALLGLEQPPKEDSAAIPCVILSLNERRAAIAVDRLVDEREAIIKDTNLPYSTSGLTAGGIPMEDGSVAVMLNVNGLFERFGRTREAAVVAPPPANRKPRKNRILVVDDSLTTRSLEKSILEANGYQVQLAVDGLDALERLRIEMPDLVISDVMMPRMTGFQLLEKIKEDKATKHLPVILVTSLESREEQQTGLTLGADAYIVKRKFDQRELLNVIRQIL